MSFCKPIDVRSLREFECEIEGFGERLKNDGWPKAEVVFRGLADGLRMTTTFERAISNWDVGDGVDKPLIESRLIRDFRRGYRGPDAERVLNDTCYCSALMQHHGAPTRMLDWTYSPYIAAQFALDKRRPRSKNSDRTCGVVWCLNAHWLSRAAREIVGHLAPSRWNETRSDKWFRRLFLSSPPPKGFVLTANPFNLNERLRVQQGVFLCQGNVSRSFISNLRNTTGYKRNLRLIRLSLDGDQLQGFGQSLWRMNVSSASLFPGLDGYAKSLAENPMMFSMNGSSQSS